MQFLLRILSFFSVLVLFGCRGKVATHQSKAALIEALILDLNKKHLFNGAIVTGEEDKIIFSNGFGFANFTDSIPFSPQTSADGGSNAKPFTAAAILLLAEEGKLKLGEPLQTYLPNYPYPHTTVLNCITHSVGGLPDYDYFFGIASDTSVVSNTLILELIAKQKPALVYQPGTNFYYDNVGFDMGALVIEHVTGKSYKEFLKERFFDALEMDSSFVRPALLSSWKPGRSIGYSYNKDSLQVFDIADREGFHGGGNIWFTAEDLYRWGQSFYHHRVLPPRVIQKICSPVTIFNKLSHLTVGAWYYGRSADAFYYWGNVAGFYSWVYWDKKNQFTIAFMTNTNMPQWTRPLLTSALINIMEGKEYQEISEPAADIVDKNKLEQLTGVYEIDQVGRARINVVGKQMKLTVNNGMEYNMYQVNDKTFYVPGFDPWISFSELKNNKFQEIIWSSTVLQAKGKRISN